MISIATSVIAGAIIVVFLGYYAVTLNQVPLWIVIIVVLAMTLTDFVLTVRDERGRKPMGKQDNEQKHPDGSTG